MKLYVGCGQHHREGFVNCDLHPTPAADVVFDAQEKWPFEDNVADEVQSAHMLEHLDDPWAFFREAWRVLRPGGLVSLQLPYGASEQALTDITHKKAWMPGSFCAFQPGYGEAIGNPQHDAWAYPFAINFVGMRIHKDNLWLCRWPIRYVGLRMLKYLWNGFTELIVQMQALKTPGQVALFHERSLPNTCPVALCAWMNEWNPKYTGPLSLQYFATGHAITTHPDLKRSIRCQ